MLRYGMSRCWWCMFVGCVMKKWSSWQCYQLVASAVVHWGLSRGLNSQHLQWLFRPVCVYPLAVHIGSSFFDGCLVLLGELWQFVVQAQLVYRLGVVCVISVGNRRLDSLSSLCGIPGGSVRRRCQIVVLSSCVPVWSSIHSGAPCHCMHAGWRLLEACICPEAALHPS